MKKLMIATLIGAIAVPAVAVQPQDQAPAQAPATKQAGPHTLRGQLTLFQMPNYNGDQWVVDTASRSVRTEWPIRSLTVHPGDRWQICARTSFRDCIVIDRNVPDASQIGISNQIGSARPAPPEASN